jgi:hypothetical protein|tara:strand:- start:85 stop:882 length:798 start_codon:yes stop_codon:yes gene_type:complete
MDMTNIVNKLGNKINYNAKAKGYRYQVDGSPKGSVTTIIGKYIKPDLKNWYKKNRDDAVKELMLREKKPINEINDFLAKVKTICDAKESYGRDIGTQLHEWIDLFLKGKKPVLPSDQPLKRMAEKFTDFWKKHKFKVIESELPLYSKKFDLCGTNDVIVTKDSWKGQLAVLDWKTSKDYSFENCIQVEMYRRFIEETTDFKIQKLAIVNIPKEDGKELSFFEIDSKLIKNERYFKGFRAIKYLADTETKFKENLKKWKKENKINV